MPEEQYADSALGWTSGNLIDTLSGNNEEPQAITEKWFSASSIIDQVDFGQD